MGSGANRPSAGKATKLKTGKEPFKCGMRPNLISVIAKHRAPGVAAFGRKPPSKFPPEFPALCRDAATSAVAPAAF